MRSASGDAHVREGEVGVSPPELLAPLIREVRDAAERQLGEAIGGGRDGARARAATRSGGRRSRRVGSVGSRCGGWSIRRRRRPWPISRSGFWSDELIAVIDFGAGGFDAALIEVGERNVEVLAQRGIAVGGEDLDARVVDWLLAEFREQTGVDGTADPVVRARMRDVAERTRIALSDAKDAEVHLPYLAADEAGPKHLHLG
jgi:molecular chaperone DnaK